MELPIKKIEGKYDCWNGIDRDTVLYKKPEVTNRKLNGKELRALGFDEVDLDKLQEAYNRMASSISKAEYHMLTVCHTEQEVLDTSEDVFSITGIAFGSLVLSGDFYLFDELTVISKKEKKRVSLKYLNYETFALFSPKYKQVIFCIVPKTMKGKIRLECIAACSKLSWADDETPSPYIKSSDDKLIRYGFDFDIPKAQRNKPKTVKRNPRR